MVLTRPMQLLKMGNRALVWAIKRRHLAGGIGERHEENKRKDSQTVFPAGCGKGFGVQLRRHLLAVDRKDKVHPVPL